MTSYDTTIKDRLVKQFNLRNDSRNEPRPMKTGFLRMRKQRRRSAPLFSLHV